MKKRYLSIVMTKQEIVFGLAFLPFYLELLSPILQALLALLLRRKPDMLELNICFFFANLIILLPIFRRFLLCNLRNCPWKKTLTAIPTALFCFYTLNILINLIILSIRPDFSNQNNDSIVQMLRTSPGIVFVMAVILAPIIEETLFRGLIFGNLLRIHRLLAYVVTVLGFAAIHVVNYLPSLTLLDVVLSMLQYLPAAITLCMLYESTDNLIPPILLHAINNLIGCLVVHFVF